MKKTTINNEEVSLELKCLRGITGQNLPSPTELARMVRESLKKEMPVIPRGKDFIRAGDIVSPKKIFYSEVSTFKNDDILQVTSVCGGKRGYHYTLEGLNHGRCVVFVPMGYLQKTKNRKGIIKEKLIVPTGFSWKCERCNIASHKVGNQDEVPYVCPECGLIDMMHIDILRY